MVHWRILDNSKGMCEFNNKARHPYNLKQLEDFAENKVLEADFKEDIDSDSEFEDGDDESDVMDEDSVEEDGTLVEGSISQSRKYTLIIIWKLA